jgi:RHS repeat-associated protein
MVLKTQYFYQGRHPSVAMNSRGNFAFVRSGPQSFAELRHDETLSRNLLLACDGNHSVLDRTDHTAHPLEPCRYTAYGHDNTALRTRLGFNGELQNLQENLYLLGIGKRIYSPSLMRFYTPDSFSPFDAGGFNAYIYCSNDPINYTDPSGHTRRPRTPPSGMNTPKRIDRPSSPIGAPLSTPSWDASWDEGLYPLPSPAAIPTSPVPSTAVSDRFVASPLAQTGRQSPVPGTSSALYQPLGPRVKRTGFTRTKAPFTTAQLPELLSWNASSTTSLGGLSVAQTKLARELVIDSKKEGSSGNIDWYALRFKVEVPVRKLIWRSVKAKAKRLRKS